MYLAVTDPTSVLTSGNTVAILALIVTTLFGVVIYMSRKIDQKDNKIEELQNSRLNDFKEREDRVNSTLELVGRNTQYMYDKMIDGNK